MKNNKVAPVEARQVEYDEIKKAVKAEISKRPHGKNIRQWIIALACGTVSMVTCCMCCGGCCGSVPSPLSLVDSFSDDEPASLCPDEKKFMNVTNWCGMGALAMRCLPTCGCCCGVFSPSEALMTMADVKK